MHTLHSIFLIPEGGTSQEQFAKVLGDIKLQIHHKQLSITFFTFGEGGNASFIDNYKTQNNTYLKFNTISGVKLFIVQEH